MGLLRRLEGLFGLAKEATSDANTLVCGLKACGILRAIHKSIELHSEVERKGLFKDDLAVGNAVMDMYMKCGSLVKAQEVFDMLSEKDIMSWNLLMAGYIEQGQSEEAQLGVQSILW